MISHHLAQVKIGISKERERVRPRSAIRRRCRESRVRLLSFSQETRCFESKTRFNSHCVAGDCAGGCAGLWRGIWMAPGGGTEEMLCLRSRSDACSVAMS